MGYHRTSWPFEKEQQSLPQRRRVRREYTEQTISGLSPRTLRLCGELFVSFSLVWYHADVVEEAFRAGVRFHDAGGVGVNPSAAIAIGPWILDRERPLLRLGLIARPDLAQAQRG